MWVVDITRFQVGSPAISSVYSLTLFADPDDPDAPVIFLFNPVGGSYMFDLSIADWADRWNFFKVELRSEETASQVPAPPFSAYESFSAKYRIDQVFECVNASTAAVTSGVVSSYTTEPDEPTSCEPTPGDLRNVCYAGQGVSSLIYKSTPLGACNGCTITDSNFQPALDNVQQVEASESAEICLCATGGTGDYSYSILDGSLACGRSLDEQTGCITGDPDDTCPGSPTITFGVFDRGGAGTVGGFVTIGGTCRLSGHNAERLSGGAWTSDMVGHAINIAGTNYTVDTVTDASHLVVL